jgi:putative endonuclease
LLDEPTSAAGARFLGRAVVSCGSRGFVDWSIYIARCADDTLYVGIALDVRARIAQHDAGKGARYTRGRGPLRVLATRRCRSQGDALRLERALKNLGRQSSRYRLARLARACSDIVR